MLKESLNSLDKKKCEVDAPITIGSNTTVKLDDDIIISAPSSDNVEPFIHSSLLKASIAKGFYSTYNSVLRIGKLESGRVVISHIVLTDNIKGKSQNGSTVSIAAVAALLLAKR